MGSLFFRLATDHTRTPAALEGTFAGPQRTACWLIGGGPSLRTLPCEGIRESPLPKMAVNLAGSRVLRPTFWTSYDPSVRFHRSVYLDPSILKFVHARRAMDLVPESTFKVCECPSTYFFERDCERGFADFLSTGHRGVVDWADSFVQAIDILYRLGFRVIYLAGCELRIRPSRPQRLRGTEAGVRYNPGETLGEYVRRCNAAGVTTAELDQLAPGPQYHFDEHKPLAAAINTDFHYFRVSQYLRLCRRSIGLAGTELISVTPHSRLNEYFPYMPASQVLERIRREIGDPREEPVSGLYRQTIPRGATVRGQMRDFRPHNWQKPCSGSRMRGRPDAGADLLVEREGLECAPAGGPGKRSREDEELLARLRTQRAAVCEDG